MYIQDCVSNFIGKTLINKCIDRPVFIVGAGRSGTSVLLQAIGKHPDILVFPGEAPFLTSIGGNAALFESELNKDNSKYFRESLKINIDYLYKELARLGLETAGGKHYALRQYVKNLWSNKNFHLKQYWSAKTSPSENIANALVKVYPHARFIYIVRNGIEVVHSRTKYHGFRDKEFEDHCQVWNDSVKKYRYLLQYKNAICVRHENLVLDPIGFFSSIFNFLDLPDSLQCTGFVREVLIHSLDQQSQQLNNALEQLRNRESPFNSWSLHQQNIFKEKCSDAMLELGYLIQ